MTMILAALLAALTWSTLFAFLIFSAILGLVAWGVYRLVKVEAIRVVLWVILGVFWLLMIYDLFSGGHRSGLLP
jgi:hypothetical protein